MNEQAQSKLRVAGRAVVTGFLAFSLGFAIGALFSLLVPDGKYSWAGLATIPLWLALEVALEGSVLSFGNQSKYVQLICTLVLLSGFYASWFFVRGAGV